MRSFHKYLNPLYKELDSITDFSNITDLTPLLQEELPHLEKVTLLTGDTIKTLLENLKRLELELEEQILRIQAETGLDDKSAAVSVYNKILRSIEDLVKRINSEITKIDSPYFGKIVFSPKESLMNRDMNIYIGKFACIDKDTKIPLVTDWRAPIANLYYENSGPKDNVSFVAPAGKRDGNLKQKRQFQISNARIKNIYDAKSGNAAADEFLLSQLNERLGKKLTDIVATIQDQQNSIIREDINKPTIIQGVAGSGKTTILLHRLAYLFYTYKEKISPENSLVIAPNKMFQDYISDVLPNLGVYGVNILTYIAWAKGILGWNNKYVVSPEKENLKYKEFKGSSEFLNILDKYFESFEEKLLENIPYSRNDIITRRYYELKKEFPYITMDERLDLASEYAFAQKQFRLGRTGFYDNSYDLDQKIKRDIQAYFKKSTNPYEIYRSFLKLNLVSKEFSKYSLEGIKATNGFKYYRIEDLASILYLHLKLYGHKEHERDYVMVDETQDMSVVQIATLLMIAKNFNITLAGDLAQSIIPPFYIKDWKLVQDLFDFFSIKNHSYHQLNRCYRTTVEIIEFSNKIFKKNFPDSYTLPEAVLRHGEEVNTKNIGKDMEDLNKKEIKEFLSGIKKDFDRGFVTCALICRDKNHSRALYSKLKGYEDYLGRDIIDYTQEDYKGGFLILAVEDAKGLEFDSVYIADLNTDRYSNSELDTRLLYVAITRALHRLTLIQGENSYKV